MKARLVGLKGSVYCQCGAAMRYNVSPREAARDLLQVFASMHRGEGHGPATKEQARRARRRP